MSTSDDHTQDDGAFPDLTPSQLERIRAISTTQVVGPGDILFQVGDRDYDFMFVESGEVEIVRTATPDSPEEVIVTHGAGRFMGEWNMLSGQAAFLTARVSAAGRILRVPREDFRHLMDRDAELSDLIMRAFLARRQLMQSNGGARSVEILGSRLSSATHALRNWAARQQIAHVWLDIDEPGGRALAATMGVQAADLPVVVTPTGIIARATAGAVAEELGLSFRAAPGTVYDVVVIGGGPAGLAAAVYGASEGLTTTLLDAIAVGGQAAASSRIENYLGFPAGISGTELTARGLVQAQKFGATVSTPCEVARLHAGGGTLRLNLTDGTEVAARAIVIATGARYRKLPLDRWDDFEGTGIFFAATELEARTCVPDPVAVVGGANSAGQAAIYLADRGSTVDLVVRGPDLAKEMSSYLVERVIAHPRIEVRTETQVTALHGDDSLDEISTTDADGATTTRKCRGLFCFIGADPSTSWLDAVDLDEDGFVLTDRHLDNADLSPAWALLGRPPLPFETSVPAVFAVGDVRHGSMKRVAAAVGEGASAIRSVHTAIAPLN